MVTPLVINDPDLLYKNKNFKLCTIRIVDGQIHLPTLRAWGASYVAKIIGPDPEKRFKRKFINPTKNLYAKRTRYPCGRLRRIGFRWKLPLPPGLYEIQRPAPFWFMEAYNMDLARTYLAFYPDGGFEWMTKLEICIRIYGPIPELLKKLKTVQERVDAIDRYYRWKELDI